MIPLNINIKDIMLPLDGRRCRHRGEEPGSPNRKDSLLHHSDPKSPKPSSGCNRALPAVLLYKSLIYLGICCKQRTTNVIHDTNNLNFQLLCEMALLIFNYFRQLSASQQTISRCFEVETNSNNSDFLRT